ncbi:DUF1622 domain-containing protein [Georgenia thermotolerans]|uniref:DUF1622 domain-containing protein n=1 Tax=Georgenia thermotolerans TaxID=527326 RepID=A0A7J5UJF3_9MICO|nr:DUF1622 domain-containing protein [Georgenia thermotolerans]KAE8762446.1 DUF1622 domain-containing protein [Georgenia thermotolerans]
MSTVLSTLALAAVAAGLVVGVGAVLVVGVRAAIGVLLDFLLAAGLLRLAAEPGWSSLLSTALVVAVRHLITTGLSVGAAWDRPGATGAP